jgi:hypothetical protein
VTALEAEWRAAPQAFEDGERLVELLRSRAAIGRLADLRPATVIGRPEPDAEHEPAVRDVVERHRLARDLPRTPSRQGLDHRADPHALGRHGEGRHQHPRIVDLELVANVDAVPREHAVPAGGLGRPSELDLLVDGAAGQDDAELHRDATRAGLTTRSARPRC